GADTPVCGSPRARGASRARAPARTPPAPPLRRRSGHGHGRARTAPRGPRRSPGGSATSPGAARPGRRRAGAALGRNARPPRSPQYFQEPQERDPAPLPILLQVAQNREQCRVTSKRTEEHKSEPQSTQNYLFHVLINKI